MLFAHHPAHRWSRLAWPWLTMACLWCTVGLTQARAQTQAQASIQTTASLDRLKQALELERKTDFSGAQALYQTLLNDADWAAAAHLSLARIQRWQYQFAASQANYAHVLAHPLATAGMKDEAHLGLAQINTLQWRLPQAKHQLNQISSASALAEQIQALRKQIETAHASRLSIQYGQIHSKAGATQSSHEIELRHQLDLRNSLAWGYAHNSLQQLSAQPDATLDIVQNQWRATWHHKLPQQPSYELQAMRRTFKLSPAQTILTAQASWPVSPTWHTDARLEQHRLDSKNLHHASLNLSAKISKQWQWGGTLYASQTNSGIQHSQMLHTSWESPTWLAQWFISQSAQTGAKSQAIVLRHRLQSGLSWTAEIKRDQNGHTSKLGIQIPWGSHSLSSSIQISPMARQWSAGLDYAWPQTWAPQPSAPTP